MTNLQRHIGISFHSIWKPYSLRFEAFVIWVEFGGLRRNILETCSRKRVHRFSKNGKPPQNSRHEKGDMQDVPYWRSISIKCPSTIFSCHSDSVFVRSPSRYLCSCLCGFDSSVVILIYYRLQGTSNTVIIIVVVAQLCWEYSYSGKIPPPIFHKRKEGTTHGISFKIWNNTKIMVVMTLLTIV